MKSKRKVSILIVVAVVIAAAVIAVSLFLKSGISDTRNIDLSDVETMNIGAEMPELVYGNSDTVVMYGTFGILEIDLNTENIVGRVSSDKMAQNGIVMPDVSASADGKKVFITDSKTGNVYECNVKSGKIISVSKMDDELFSTTEINTYDEQNESYFDFHYIVNGNIVQNDVSYLYLRADTDWSMKSLQLVECDNKTKSEIKVINIFKSATEITENSLNPNFKILKEKIK